METAAFEVITPDVARQYLARNHGNRPVNKAHVQFLAEQILLDDWECTGQGISFDTQDILQDGQHRCAAVILANKPIRTLVVRGVSTTARMVIDKNRVRLLSQDLRMSGQKYPTEKASIMKLCINVLAGRDMRSSSLRTMGAFEKYYNLFEEQLEALVPMMRKNRTKIGRPAAVIAPFVLAYPGGPFKVVAMAEKIVTGVGLVEKEPAHTLRNFLIDTQYSGNATTVRMFVRKVSRAILAELRNEKLTILHATEEGVKYLVKLNEGIQSNILMDEDDRKKLLEN